MNKIDEFECCRGCMWHASTESKIPDDIDADEFGCGNPYIAAEWCLKPGRDGIKGIFYEKERIKLYNHMTITEYVAACYENSVEKGFWNHPVREVGTVIALMHSELSELLELFRQEYFDPDKVEEEVADIFIRLADFCGYYKINLESAIDKKMCYNKSRPRKNGKRF